MIPLVQAPSVTKLVLASGTPVYRDPYRKVGLAYAGYSRSVLLDDPVEAVGEVGKNALTWLLVEVLGRVGGEIGVTFAGPPSDAIVRVAAPIAVEGFEPSLVEAANAAARLPNASVREQALGTLRSLGTYLPGGTDRLSPVVVSDLEDGSALIEWPLPGRRLGFALYADPATSGWFFVSNAEWGNIMASGAWADAPMEQLVAWALGTHP